MNVYMRKKNGYWNAQIVYSLNGRKVERWHKTSVQCRKTGTAGERNARREAQAWVDEVTRDLERRAALTDLEVHEYCRAHVDLLLRSGQIEPSTHQRYGTSLNYIRRHFGNMLLADVRTRDVESFLSWLRDDLGLSQNTVKKTYNVLKACLRHAVHTRELDWNPCDPVMPPRQKRMVPNALTEESRATFLERMSALELTPEVMATWIAYYTGCRRGEVCCLRWRDLREGASGSLHAVVAGSVGIMPGGTFEKGTKNGDSRVVPVPTPLEELLVRRRLVMEGECAAAGIPFSGDLFVCGDIAGGWLSPSRVSKWWTAHRSEWGLMGTQGRPPVFHDLRHTYATVAVRNMDPKTAQSILGHRDINMTMQYADTDMGHVDAAGRAMAGALAPKAPTREAAMQAR